MNPETIQRHGVSCELNHSIRRLVRRLFWNKRFRIFLWKCDIIPVSVKELEVTWGAACQRCHDNYDSGNKLEEQFQQGIALSTRQMLNDYTPKLPPDGRPSV